MGPSSSSNAGPGLRLPRTRRRLPFSPGPVRLLTPLTLTSLTWSSITPLPLSGLLGGCGQWRGADSVVHPLSMLGVSDKVACESAVCDCLFDVNHSLTFSTTVFPVDDRSDQTHAINRKVEVVYARPFAIKQTSADLALVTPASRFERHELLQNFLLPGPFSNECGELASIDAGVQLEQISSRLDTLDCCDIGEEQVDVSGRGILGRVGDVGVEGLLILIWWGVDREVFGTCGEVEIFICRQGIVTAAQHKLENAAANFLLSF